MHLYIYNVNFILFKILIIITQLGWVVLENTPRVDI